MKWCDIPTDCVNDDVLAKFQDVAIISLPIEDQEGLVFLQQIPDDQEDQVCLTRTTPTKYGDVLNPVLLPQTEWIKTFITKTNLSKRVIATSDL